MNLALWYQKIMSFYLFVRYFFSKRSGSLIKFVSRLCLIGIAVSVSALILIVSVMEGFGRAIKSRLLDKQAHLTLFLDKNPFLEQAKPFAGKELFIRDKNKELAFLKPEQKKAIQSSKLFETQELILNKDSLFKGVLARGFSKESFEELKKKSLQNFWNGLSPASQLSKDLTTSALKPAAETESFLDRSGYFLKNSIFAAPEKNILISYDLALKTDLKKGDQVRILPLGGLLLPPQIPPPVKLFTVAGVFEESSSSSSLYYEQGTMDFGELSKSRYKAEIQLKQPDKILEQEKLFKNYETKNWMEQNSYFFFALRLEKFIMILFFSMALIISCLGVSSSLLLLMTQKTEDIAILQALGCAKERLTQIWTKVGLYLSSLGLILGALTGFLAVLFLKQNQLPLLPEMYQDRSIPAETVPFSYVLILLGAFLVSWIFCYLPSRHFSRISALNLLKNKGYG